MSVEDDRVDARELLDKVSMRGQQDVGKARGGMGEHLLDCIELFVHLRRRQPKLK